MKHTEGQWNYVETNEEARNNANPFDIYALPHQCIAHVTSWRSEANAKLIASAPELLEALQWIENHALQNGCSKDALKAVAQAAIKKATE